jgi:ketosteroid isomerase-like protein
MPPMKTKFFLFAFLIFTLPATADVESDRAALRVIKGIYEQACKSGDPQKLAPYLTRDATGVMVTGEEVTGIDGIKAYWAKIQALMGPGGRYSTAINVETTDVFGDTSVSRGTTDDLVHLASGRELRFNTRWTAVCRRENDGWKIHRMQASLDPIQNVFVAARISAAKITFGLGGVVAGFLIAFLLLRRKSKSTLQASPPAALP